SRGPDEVVEEIRGLVDRGVHELVLIAQDLGSYGKDIGSADLSGLLRRVTALPGDFWVRLLYIHPEHFPDELLDIAASDGRILPYFDLPFQHASPRILRAMGRRGDTARNLALVERIRSRLPGAAIRSTFLVGVPGETDDDFTALCDFQDAARLDWVGAFAYSREEDTPAYGMTPRVAAGIAADRKAAVEERQIPITAAALDARIGATVDVLVEERIEGEEMSLGRAFFQAPDVDGLVVVRGKAEPGAVVRVRLEKRNGVDMEGARA
ncbi:MAG TPA: radical SAM protein, partial [Spirochaetia bacterium]